MQRDEVANNKDGKKIDLKESRIFLQPEEKKEWKNLKSSLFSEENGVVLKFYKAVNKNDELNSRKSSRDASAFKTAFDFAEREKIHEI